MWIEGTGENAILFIQSTIVSYIEGPGRPLMNTPWSLESREGADSIGFGGIDSVTLPVYHPLVLVSQTSTTTEPTNTVTQAPPAVSNSQNYIEPKPPSISPSPTFHCD